MYRLRARASFGVLLQFQAPDCFFPRTSNRDSDNRLGFDDGRDYPDRGGTEISFAGARKAQRKTAAVNRHGSAMADEVVPTLVLFSTTIFVPFSGLASTVFFVMASVFVARCASELLSSAAALAFRLLLPASNVSIIRANLSCTQVPRGSNRPVIGGRIRVRA